MGDVEMGEPATAYGLLIGGEDVLPWVEKYRPKDMDHLLAHEEIIQTINRFVDRNTLPHLLLHGPPGTGKTSTILACARKMYGPKYNSHCLELNASDARGIDVVREEIKGFASAQQLFASKHPKLIILDEADHMTTQAQFALRRIIETFHKTTRFCLICNYTNKIIPALQSRCTRFRFVPLTVAQMFKRTREICDEEGVKASDDGITALAELSGGDMRKVLNVLQATVLAKRGEEVDRHAVYATTGTPLPADITKVLETLMTASFADALGFLDKMRVEKGYSLRDLLLAIFEAVVDIELPSQARHLLMPQLAELEWRLAKGSGEKMQAAALVAAFTEVRGILTGMTK